MISQEHFQFIVITIFCLFSSVALGVVILNCKKDGWKKIVREISPMIIIYVLFVLSTMPSIYTLYITALLMGSICLFVGILYKTDAIGKMSQKIARKVIETC